eukprot:TRINITY_DN1954_c0_g1_i1.p2 TRINITY_DN1954_c0_g1~~TRINITY_DN1954_c0_g1_i1.p2  ORF type:complete len:677 (+),score=241.07 TRINITY_DN1954_c0_g1_i1:86-2116(+)
MEQSGFGDESTLSTFSPAQRSEDGSIASDDHSHTHSHTHSHIVGSRKGWSVREEDGEDDIRFRRQDHFASTETFERVRRERELMNEKLRRIGFNPLPPIEAKELHFVLHEELVTQALKTIIDRHMQVEGVLRSISSSEDVASDGLSPAKKEEIMHLRERVSMLEKEVASLTTQLETAKRDCDVERRRLTSESQRLSDQVRENEQKLRVVKKTADEMERERDRIRIRLDDVISESERKRRLGEDSFHRLMHRHPRLPADHQVMEIIERYESLRERKDSEIEHLRKEVQRMQDQIVSMDTPHASPQKLGASSKKRMFEGRESELLDELQQSRTEFDTLSRKVDGEKTKWNREKKILRDTVVELKRVNDGREKEIADLELELAGRPTIEAHRRIKKLWEELQKRVSQYDGFDPDYIRRHGYFPPQRRGDEMKRLGLEELENLSPRIARTIVTDVCLTLQVSRIDDIVPRILEMDREILNGKAMKKTFKNILNVLSSHTGKRVHESEMLDVLSEMQKTSAHEDHMSSFMEELNEVVLSRSTSSSFGAKRGASVGHMIRTEKNLLEAVRELVEMEKRVREEEEKYKRSETRLKEAGQILSTLDIGKGAPTLEDVMKYFMYLFDVRELRGAIPRLSELYMFVNESKNSFRALRSILRMGEETPPKEILRAIEELFDRAADLE